MYCGEACIDQYNCVSVYFPQYIHCFVTSGSIILFGFSMLSQLFIISKQEIKENLNRGKFTKVDSIEVQKFPLPLYIFYWEILPDKLILVVRNINGRECILTALGIFSEGSKTQLITRKYVQQELLRTGVSVGWASGCHVGGHEFDFGRPTLRVLK